MKYCSNCGNELNDEAIICVKCGQSCSKQTLTESTTEACLLFVFSIFLPVVGFVVGLVLHSNNQRSLSKKCFSGAIIGTIIYGIIILVICILPFIYLWTFF